MSTRDLRFLNRALEAENAILRGALSAQGVELVAEPPTWAAGLRKQEAEMVGVLLRAHPLALDRYDIEARLPGRDHAAERDVRLVDVLVCTVRRKLGAAAIQTVRGTGYRLADDTASCLLASLSSP